MKKVWMMLCAVLTAWACQSAQDVPFTEVDHYYFRNDAAIPGSPRIDSQEAFNALFGPAAVMGTGGQPPAVDFSKEFVIAVVEPVTDVLTELLPVSLDRQGGDLIFTYEERTGETVGWSMQPLLLIKVDRAYDATNIRLVCQEGSLPPGD